MPRQWKVIQTVREKFTCRSCETITQPPAPFHVIARGRAGPSLLAMILYAKYGQHQPLNRQSETYAREGIDLGVSTLADHVGACAAALSPLTELIRRHVFAAERLHGDDTTVPRAGQGQDDHRPVMDLCARRPAVWRPRSAGGGVLLLARSHRRASRTGISRAMPASCRPTPMPGSTSCTTAGASPGRSPRRRAGPWPAQVLRAGRSAARRRWRSRRSGGSTRSSPSSARSTACRPATAWPCASSDSRAARRRSRKLDARRTRQAVAPCRNRQGDGLHADALAGLHPLPRRRPHLPDATTPPSARCAALPSGAERGCSPAPIAAASGPRRCTR